MGLGAAAAEGLSRVRATSLVGAMPAITSALPSPAQDALPLLPPQTNEYKGDQEGALFEPPICTGILLLFRLP